MSERLVKLKTKNGKIITFSREEDKSVRVCHDGFCVNLSNATGKITLEMLALLGDLEEDNGKDRF